MLKCLDPVIDDNCTSLILGSFPSELSLKTGMYYGNPLNQFWKIMGRLLNFSENLPYIERLEILKSNGIALFDVYSSCNRIGSLDSSIKDITINPLSKIFETYNIERVFLNGRKAETGFKMLNLPVTAFYLPSTSPANTTSFETKLEKWRIIL